MDILLQRRTDIPVVDVASALGYAANGGHLSLFISYSIVVLISMLLF
jgi:hypothetical protein